jgi:hypothetical protein
MFSTLLRNSFHARPKALSQCRAAGNRKTAF